MSRPYLVTLRFRSKIDRNIVMGQLTDGWGENNCDCRPSDTRDVYNMAPSEEDKSHYLRVRCHMRDMKKRAALVQVKP